MQFNQYDQDGKLLQCDVYLDDGYEFNYHLNYLYNLKVPKIILHSAIEISKGELQFITKAIQGFIKEYPKIDADYLISLLDDLSDLIINDVEDLITDHEQEIKQLPSVNIFEMVVEGDVPSPQDIIDNVIDESNPSDKTLAVNQLKKSYKDNTPDKDTGVPQGLLNQLSDILKK